MLISSLQNMKNMVLWVDFPQNNSCQPDRILSASDSIVHIANVTIIPSLLRRVHRHLYQT